NTAAAKAKVSSFIPQTNPSDLPALVSQTDSLVYVIDSPEKLRPAFPGQLDKALCGARLDIDKDGTAEWFIGDERGVRLQTSDGWVLFRYPSSGPIQSVQVIRGKSGIALWAWDGTELLVLNAAGQCIHRLPVKSSDYQVSQGKSGLFLQFVTGSGLRIRQMHP
ncbi:MAG: hypothetical protein ACKOQY_06400, partial [Bacteroidota bacterium]